MADHSFKDIKPKICSGLYNAEHVNFGIPIPKTKRIELFSEDEWEEFTVEWVSSLESKYYKIQRYAGAGDKGLDVVGFFEDSTFDGGWDNYQCKYYDHPLYPSDVWLEFGKIIYYTYKGDYPPPKNYYFVAPKQLGTTLGKLLANPSQLEDELKKKWRDHCQEKITDKDSVVLESSLLQHFQEFDFSIFSSVTLVEMIEGHAKTQNHAVRFGGGLGVRPEPEIPVSKHTGIERRYAQQLLATYASSIEHDIDSFSLADLAQHKKFDRDFDRQRERFYHAESLRNFSRDNVPEGTFGQLQDDIYYGVVDTCEDDYKSPYERMKETIKCSVSVIIESNPLASVTKTADKQGICHQLVDSNRLGWLDNE
ncbi:MAG: hypothetical protein MI750_16605 [Xanthomonadales bacterium]|nr:hypothetical protein [Xanthomonadales bacterium]